MSETERYCEACDDTTTEWDIDHEGQDACPRCNKTLYESKEAYTDEMIRWLGDRFDWSKDDVLAFLFDHGNPGKGQALALISTKERREGRYLRPDTD